MTAIERPSADEFAPFYAGYIGGVPDGDITDVLEQQGRELTALLSPLDETQAERRYEPGK
ncbi:MAG TPA: hypothetical protein VIJ16_05875 [Gemmatimonadaceae bacterium]